jgi:beta-ribofuranosylaminobenzene 5'-phosphate synthase
MDEVNIMKRPAVSNVTVRASARLHLGFLDLHGGLGRVYGSLGVSLQQPRSIIEVRSQNTGVSVTGEYKNRVIQIAKQFLQYFKISHGLQIKVLESIPEHVGLGSGTQLGLAIGAGISRLVGTKSSAWELAGILGRGSISGVGTASFASGGFVVDGGKRTRKSTNESDAIPPLIIRHDVPKDWYFVVAIPNVVQGLSGSREERAFRILPSATPESAQIVSRLVVMKILPALVEDEIERFGEALTQIQILVGEAFASAQGGRFASPEVTHCVNAMLEAGAKGVGQSSWGPACYGLVRGAQAATELKKAILEEMEAGPRGPVFISTVNNHGAKIIIS